jgi:NAD dependent epimerase/dehydratase family enzyme
VIIGGATGLTGKELVKQALDKPEITTVVAISRRPLTTEQGAGHAKLRNVIVKDYDQYPEDVKMEFVGAGACIWWVPAWRSRDPNL